MVENLVIYDIETICNCFIVCFLDITTLKRKSFILHEELFQLEELITFLKSLIDHNYKMVGFNNVWFDSQVLDYIWHKYRNGYKAEKDVQNNNLKKIARILCIEDIYKESQRVIKTEDYEKYSKLKPEWKLFIPQIDLYLISHYDNAAKRSSLKWLEFSMGLDNIQEMPYSHKDILTYEQSLECLDYCWNDINTTYQLYLRNVNAIQLRKNLTEKYNLPFINYNNGKIGSELILDLYCIKTGKNKTDVRKLKTIIEKIEVKDIIFPYIEFQSKEFNEVLNKFKELIIINNGKGFIFKKVIKEVKYVYGQGGIHGSCNPGVYEISDDYKIIDVDVSSLYPSIAIQNKLYPEHLGIEFYDVYNNDIVSVRLGEKAKGKDGNKIIIDGFKEAANVVYGKSNDHSSWLFDTKYTMTTTINGQLLLSMLVEKILELENCFLLQVNTDGASIKIHTSQYDNFKQICSDWEKLTKLQLEYVEYKKMVILTVNDYIAVKLDNSAKFKGDFTIDIELHKNPSMKIVPLALKAYYINNIDYKEFILNHNNIKDFCLGCKVKSDFTLTNHKIINGEYIQEKGQKVTRYFICKKGGNLVKHYPQTLNREERVIDVQSGWKSEILNKIDPLKDIKTYNIDYNYYIKAVERIIFAIKSLKIQSKLF